MSSSTAPYYYAPTLSGGLRLTSSERSASEARSHRSGSVDTAAEDAAPPTLHTRRHAGRRVGLWRSLKAQLPADVDKASQEARVVASLASGAHWASDCMPAGSRRRYERVFLRDQKTKGTEDRAQARMIAKDVPRTYGGICVTWWDQMRHELEKTARLAALVRCCFSGVVVGCRCRRRRRRAARPRPASPHPPQ